MDHTTFLSQLIGIFSIIMGLSMLLKRKMLMEIFGELFTNRLVSYVMGVAILLIGLLLVLTHNLWQGGLETVVITVVGWIVALESLVYLFLSKAMLKKYGRWLKNKSVYYAITFMYLLLGSYLTYAGFFR